MKKLRTFIAVPLPGVTRSSINGLIRELAICDAGVRWVEPEGLHITLKFFGEIEELQTVEISRCLQKIAAQHEPFEVALSSVGAFPATDRPRTIWVGIGEGADALVGLQSDLESALMDLGYKAETRRYHPHVTIGRVRSKIGMSELTSALQSHEDFQIAPTLAEAFVFYTSDLRKTGPIYTPIATCKLG